ncbi:MAG: hypothetical protein R3F08_13360 [Dokdonella sp.]
MVQVTDPRLGETVLDPACGTLGSSPGRSLRAHEPAGQEATPEARTAAPGHLGAARKRSRCPTCWPR